MATREEMREGIAQNAYIWDSIRQGVNTIEPFEALSEKEKKSYYVLAYQLCIYLHSQGMKLPSGESLIEEK